MLRDKFNPYREDIEFLTTPAINNTELESYQTYKRSYDPEYRKAYNKQLRKANKDKTNATKRAWQQRNKETLNAARRQKYLADLDNQRARGRLNYKNYYTNNNTELLKRVKAARLERRLLGLCTICKNPAAAGYVYCSYHVEYNQNRYQKNKRAQRVRNKTTRDEKKLRGECHCCADKATNGVFCLRHYDSRKEARANAKLARSGK